MKKLAIGTTSSHNTDSNDINVRPTYLRAIEAAGGPSILLPLEVSGEDLRQLSKLYDGFLFPGGPDIHPFPLKEEVHTQCGNVSMAQNTMELSLLKPAVDIQKPVLGICRGAQIINVGLGGDIYQDISSQTGTVFPIVHKQPYPCYLPFHHMDMRRDTLLYTVAERKTEIVVNSSHHQAVRRIAPCLMASGHALDGIIEALEMPDYPYFLALQWHPEYMWQTDTMSVNIFKSLVDACQGQREGRSAGRLDSGKAPHESSCGMPLESYRAFSLNSSTYFLSLSAVFICCFYPLYFSALLIIIY